MLPCRRLLQGTSPSLLPWVLSLRWYPTASRLQCATLHVPKHLQALARAGKQARHKRQLLR
eukprot:101070-Alexandrium_andersonii.AAC.1